MPLGGDRERTLRAGEAVSSEETLTALGAPGPVSTPVSQDRFAPGTVLADRYRIVAPLGVGGMGEVYRAQDLRLGQAVALKFISRSVGHDSSMLERLLAEVRIGRQVSHPNVCRIYDIVETRGHHFIAMEYVDGEDLASLLRRIGRLPEDKALDIARDLCAGLSAAHDRGVIHRDLKPSNIMIDGRGAARVTDFGLAVISAEQVEGERLTGTPAYMAPEQLEGEPASGATDIYALGLILFELFTGQRLFSGTLTAIVAAHKQPKPRLSSLVRVNPVIERVVLRCLEENPDERPASVRAVMAELPGGNALHAAMAAGDTPSPRLVAAAEMEGELSPRMAWLAMLGTFAILTAIILLTNRTALYQHVPLTRSPDTLRDTARDVIRTAGYPGNPSGSRFSVEPDVALVREVAARFTGEEHSRLFGRIRPAPISFMYRESAQPLVASGVTRVNWNNPPLTSEGMKAVALDARGDLVAFRSIPSTHTAAGGTAVDWGVWFGLARLDMKRFRPSADAWLSPVDQDEKRSWTGTIAGQEQLPLQVRAAAYRGRPVSFTVDVARPATPAKEPYSAAVGPHLSRLMTAVVFGSALLLSLFAARRNYVRGRGDRSGAMKIAVFVGIAWLISDLFRVDHTTAIASEWAVLSAVIALALFTSAQVWLAYMALEPYVRRHQPEMLISWSRVLRGNWRDPLVGRHVLLGCLFGMVVNLLFGQFAVAAGSLFGQPAVPNYSVYALGGWSVPLSRLFGVLSWAPVQTLVYIFLYTVGKAFLKTEWVVVPLIVGVAALAGVNRGLGSPSEIVFVTLGLSFIYVALRFSGLLGATVANATATFVNFSIFIFEPSSWMFGQALFSVVVIAAITIWAFKTSLGMKPILGNIQWVE